MSRTTQRPTCRAGRARTWRPCSYWLGRSLRGRPLPREVGHRPGTEVLAPDHEIQHDDESDLVDAEYDHVQPPGDLAIPRQHAAAEDPTRRHDDLGERVAQVEI